MALQKQYLIAYYKKMEFYGIDKLYKFLSL